MTQAAGHDDTRARALSERSRPRNPILLIAALTFVQAVAFPLFTAYGSSNYGELGFDAALISLAVCWAAGVSALVCSWVFSGQPSLALAGALGGMLFRMGLPLAALVFLRATQHPMSLAGADVMLVVYYLLTLAVETPLSLLLVRPNPRPTGAS